MTLLIMCLLGIMCIIVFGGSRIYAIGILNRVMGARKLEKDKIRQTWLFEICAYCIVIMLSTGLTRLINRGDMGVMYTLVGSVAYVTFLACVVFSIKSMWEVIEIAAYRVEK